MTYNLPSNKITNFCSMFNIFARASAAGKSGITVFRISGPDSYKITQNFIRDKYLEVNHATFAKIYHPMNNEFIDDGIVIYFKSPNSFTGEDIVEFHLHGSIAVNNIFTEAVLSLDNIRMAEPGEFAKRAFLNGKMDLTQAEGLADLIDSTTKYQHKQAARQMSGELERLYSNWREKLLKILALLEAYIDFPDEDIPESVTHNMNKEILDLKHSLKKHLSDNRRGERLRNGLHLTIFGAPNAGKSSLINFLSQRDVAIVSDIPGTTRDVIETHLDIGGFPIILADTAGLRDGYDKIEEEGIKRARFNVQNADIKILVIDASSDSEMDPNILSMIDENTIILLNKIDVENKYKHFAFEHSNNVIPCSIKSNHGLKELLKKVEDIAKEIAAPTETPAITRLRYRSNITKSLECLENFSIADDIILQSEEIRLAAKYLSLLTGKIDVETILGEIFSSFCIGK